MKLSLKLFVPPIVYEAISWFRKKIGIPSKRDLRKQLDEKPQWCQFISGYLEGRLFLLDVNAKTFQDSMLSGEYDDFLYKSIEVKDLVGKTIFDVGAHIGYHTLNFAHLVGESGRVFSFEPHPLHIQRIIDNINRNSDLLPRVKILPFGLSNSIKEDTFYYSSKVENSMSSMSFISDSSTLFPRSHYKSFKATTIHLETIDNLLDSKIIDPPDLVKIDVEGAESLVIEGAMITLEKYKPTLLIEIHSQRNMFHILEQLYPIGYELRIINEEQDGRCFLLGEGK